MASTESIIKNRLHSIQEPRVQTGKQPHEEQELRHCEQPEDARRQQIFGEAEAETFLPGREDTKQDAAGAEDGKKRGGSRENRWPRNAQEIEGRQRDRGEAECTREQQDKEDARKGDA